MLIALQYHKCARLSSMYLYSYIFWDSYAFQAQVGARKQHFFTA